MQKFMVVCWYCNSEGSVIESGVVFYNSLAYARRLVEAYNSTGDYAQLYMLHGEGPECYYVYCNE